MLHCVDLLLPPLLRDPPSTLWAGLFGTALNVLTRAARRPKAKKKKANKTTAKKNEAADKAAAANWGWLLGARGSAPAAPAAPAQEDAADGLGMAS